MLSCNQIQRKVIGFYDGLEVVNVFNFDINTIPQSILMSDYPLIRLSS